VTSKSIRSVAVDSNVLLSAVAGKAARKVFERAPELIVVTTEANYAEVEEYLLEFANRYGLEVQFVLDTLTVLPVQRYGESEYMSHLAEARKYVEGRDPDDVPLAALALKLNIPIW
jgi:predicted nucleic acid-binding protein